MKTKQRSMASPKESEAQWKMVLEEERLRTFLDWPFRENCSCTPEKMTAAGFYCCGDAREPDLVKCFVCLKELDGWDPDDNPWAEHVKHAPNCPFIKMNKKTSELTVYDMYELDRQRSLNYLKMMFEKKREDFLKNEAETRRKIAKATQNK